MIASSSHPRPPSNSTLFPSPLYFLSVGPATPIGCLELESPDQHPGSIGIVWELVAIFQLFSPSIDSLENLKRPNRTSHRFSIALL